jgi:hypothetical protein
MTIEAALTVRLKLILGHSRVYPDNVPDDQNTWPCVTYTHAGDDEQNGLKVDEGKDHIDTFTLDVWGKDRAAIVAQRDLLKAAFRGEQESPLWGGSDGPIVVSATGREASADVSPAVDGSDRHDRVERLSVRMFWYER